MLTSLEGVFRPGHVKIVDSWEEHREMNRKSVVAKLSTTLEQDELATLEAISVSLVTSKLDRENLFVRQTTAEKFSIFLRKILEYMHSG